MQDFTKVLRIGKGANGNVFVQVRYKDGTLSLSGVEGPTRGGNAKGGCGQIDMHEWNIADYAPGWDRAKELRLREVWGKWHLNDMRAGCIHQRSVDTTRMVEVVSYGLTTQAYDIRRHAQERAAIAAASGKIADLTETEKALILMPDWFKSRHAPPDVDSPLSGCFEVIKREEKAIGWTTQEEHPDGLLSRRCEICGYIYGSAWLHEEVPEEVLEFLRPLPDTDVTPAWV